MIPEKSSLALDPSPAAADAEEGFFRRALEEDRAAREETKRQLEALRKLPGLGWGIALLTASVIVLVALFLALPPPG
jgi:hypothetical protein